MRIGLHYGRHAKEKGIEHLNHFELLIIMSLLLIAGIERNPGPLSESSESSANSNSIYQSRSISLKINSLSCTTMFKVSRISWI